MNLIINKVGDYELRLDPLNGLAPCTFSKEKKGNSKNIIRSICFYIFK